MNPEKDLEGEKERLLRSEIPKEAKDDILDFLNEMRFDGKSFAHQYYYAVRLRIIATILQDKFTNPSKQDIKTLLTKLIDRKINRYVNVKKQTNGTSSPIPEKKIEQKKISDVTLEDYKKCIKHYYKWKLGIGEGKFRTEPECTRWITRNRKLGSKVKPDELVTTEEYLKIIDNCMNARDRALISTLYDSGCRLGELLTLRIRDAQSDQYGYVLSVTGKTGYRRVRIVGNSVAYLKLWIENHPNRNDIDSPVFCGLEVRNFGKAMDHSDVYSMFRKVLKRAGITRRIHPHLFRHSYVTRMVDKNLSESALKDQVGWTKGSRMIEVYEHLSIKQKDEAILRASGIAFEEKDDDNLLPVVCQRCGKKNPSNAKNCYNCWMPLTVEEAINEIEKEKKVTDALGSIISGDQKALLQNLPQESKLDVLSSLLIDLEKRGELDLIKDRLKKQNQDEQKDESVPLDNARKEVGRDKKTKDKPLKREPKQETEFNTGIVHHKEKGKN